MSGRRDVEIMLGVRRRVERRLGVLCIYGAWALMVWYLFFFGREIYSLMGDPGELGFVKGWLVGLAFQNAYGAQAGGAAVTSELAGVENG